MSDINEKSKRLARHLATAALGCLCAACGGQPGSTQATTPQSANLVASLSGIDSHIAQLAAGNFVAPELNASPNLPFQNAFRNSWTDGVNGWADTFANGPPLG